MVIAGKNSRPRRRERRLGAVEPQTTRALEALKRRLESQFGDRLAGVFLYGSRARGDHRPDSDVDVAVAFREQVGDLLELDDQLIDMAYPIQLETGLYMQLWALEESSLVEPSRHRRGQIAESVLREGIAI